MTFRQDGHSSWKSLSAKPVPNDPSLDNHADDSPTLVQGAFNPREQFGQEMAIGSESSKLSHARPVSFVKRFRARVVPVKSSELLSMHESIASQGNPEFQKPIFPYLRQSSRKHLGFSINECQTMMTSAVFSACQS